MFGGRRGGTHWNPHLSRHLKTFFFLFSGLQDKLVKREENDRMV